MYVIYGKFTRSQIKERTETLSHLHRALTSSQNKSLSIQHLCGQ
uniref:Uncharacterized protein n=1 Tax=Anguilla anguilla TaxID=7936 RepID=A0A0E9Q3S9_ANGAN